VVLINKGKRKFNQHKKGGWFRASPIPLYLCSPLLRPARLHMPETLNRETQLQRVREGRRRRAAMATVAWELAGDGALMSRTNIELLKP